MTQPIVSVNQHQVLTTSRLVAEKFNKRHDNVLRDIEQIINTCPNKQFNDLNFEGVKQFNELNFEPVNYRDAKGENRPMYNLTRDGFTMLAMGFTGQKAFLWKIAFINAFNHMEQLLNQHRQTEHHAIIDALYAKHPQWQQTRDLYVYGYSTREIAAMQHKNQRSVQRMIARIKKAGIRCTLATKLQAITA